MNKKMYKIGYHILLTFLFCSCNPAQPSHQTNRDSMQLTDTIIDGNHIRMDMYASDTSSNVYLHVFHNDLADSLVLKDYYSDIDFKGDLLFMDKQKQVTKTWIAKTNNLIIFVLPSYPAIGLYAYKVDNNKINFVSTPENSPIFSDYAFFARFDSDMVTSCYQPSAKNTSGATLWKPIGNENTFEEVSTIGYDIYLTTDSTKFINTLDSVYNFCTSKDKIVEKAAEVR